MENGSRKLAQLEKRVDQRCATMEKQFKSLRSDLRILFKFVSGLDREFRMHRADPAVHRNR